MQDKRRCSVTLGHEQKEGNFVQYGNKIIYDEGNNALQKTIAVVELDDGYVVEPDPGHIRFILSQQ